MYSDNWTNKFMADKTKESHNVKAINQIGNNTSVVFRTDGPPFKVFTLSVENVQTELIKDIIDHEEDLNILVNIKKGYRISGEALNMLHSRNITFGGMGDLMRFMDQNDNLLKIDKEFNFVSRALRQHTKIKSFERLDNKRIKIQRLGMVEVIAIMINDYEVSIESVRSSLDLYEVFRVIVKTNPNGRITSEAKSLAASLNIEICTWGEFLGKLNSQWN